MPAITPVVPQQAPPQATTTGDAISQTIAQAADLYAQQQDRKAAEAYARDAQRTAQAERARADAAGAQVRADLARMGNSPAWLVPMIILGGGALALIYFRGKRR